MKHHYINLAAFMLICSLLSSQIQTHPEQANDFTAQLANGPVEESEFKDLKDAINDNATQIDALLATEQAFDTVANASDDYFKANNKVVSGPANKSVRTFHNTSRNSSDKTRAYLRKAQSHTKETSRILQQANEYVKKATQDVHDKFIDAHQKLIESEIQQRPMKKQRLEQPAAKKSSKKSKKNMNNDNDFMLGDEIA